MSKIYPRLERKKLRKIEAGKRPYKSLDDKTMYTFLFERGIAKNGCSGYILNPYGEFSDAEVGGMISNGDDWNDYDDDYDDEAIAVNHFSTVTAKRVQVDNKPEFDPMHFTMQEITSLHNAYLDGKLEQVFAGMVEAKTAGMPTKVYTNRTINKPTPVSNIAMSYDFNGRVVVHRN